MKSFVEHRGLLVLLTLLSVSTEVRYGVSAEPATVLPRATLLTHGNGRAQLFFLKEGKHLLVVSEKDANGGAIEQVSKYAERRSFRISQSNGKSYARQVPNSTRDAIADGSVIKGTNSGSPPPQYAGSVVMRGGDRTAPVMVYDVESGTQLARWGNGGIAYESYYRSAVAVSPDGKTLVCYANAEDCLDIWDIISGVLRTSIDLAPESTDDYQSDVAVAISPDGRSVFANMYANSHRNTRVVRRYDSNNGQPLEEFVVGENDPLAISPDGRFLTTGRKIWDADAGRMVCELRADIGEPVDLMFTPDGMHLFANGEQLTIVDLMQGSVVPIAFPKMCNAFALSPDGGAVAVYSDYSSDYRNRVVLYDLGTRRLIAQCVPVFEDVGSLQFSPDGKTLAGSCCDGATLVWDVSRFSSNKEPK